MPVLSLLRWIAAVSLGILGTWVTALNYYAVVVGLTHRRHHSMIPLLGGVLLASAWLTCPVSWSSSWAWAALVADPGCLFAVASLGYAAIITRGFSR
jgi:hypothetical protein